MRPTSTKQHFGGYSLVAAVNVSYCLRKSYVFTSYEFVPYEWSTRNAVPRL